ncbi:MAG: winged helix-turn-helix domain-containing protein [Dehalococcoidia bacterium]
MHEGMGDWAPYQAIVERARDAVRVPFVVLWWIDPETQIARPVCLAGTQTATFLRAMRVIRRFFPDFEVPALRFHAFGTPATRLAHSTGQAVEAPLPEMAGEELHPLLAELGGMAGFRILRMYPVMVEGRACGTLVFNARRPLTDAQRLRAADFAEQVSLRWENTVLAQRLAAANSAGAPVSRLRYGGLTVDLQAGTATRGESSLTLTRLEFDLLAYFLARPERAIDREELARGVWQYQAVTSNFVDVSVMNLRRKLEADGASRLIHSVRGRGYMLRPGV